MPITHTAISSVYAGSFNIGPDGGRRIFARNCRDCIPEPLRRGAALNAARTTTAEIVSFPTIPS